MLRTLYVKDFAIIDRAELSFGSGMTVLTGETGAGKSLLVDALLLLSGARADAGVVRHGSQRAELSAEFDLATLPQARNWLRTRELDDDELLRLRRIIRSDGSSRAYLNDTPVSIAQLREIAEQLIEIHGQHEHQALLTRVYQRQLLDAFGGYHDVVAAVTHSAERYFELQREIEALAGGKATDPDRIEFLRFQLAELGKYALPADDYNQLIDQHRRLAHASTLLEGAQRLNAGIEGEDALGARLSRLAGEAQRLARLDSGFSGVVELLDGASIQITEAMNEIERYLNSAELDPDKYAMLDSQLARLHDLGRKHRVAPADLVARAQALAEELDRLTQAETHRDRLHNEQQGIYAEYRSAAEILSKHRHDSASRFSKEVTLLLRELSIAGQFEVQLERSNSLVRKEGWDEVEFLLSSNPGQPAKPLRKIASGGELARVALAIEVAAIGSDDVPVMVFDEVDSGIGGATAEVVGRKLRELGGSRQVLCVTHLPQVASQGHHHFAVRKSSDESSTYTEIFEVLGKARTEEVARMLGGIELGKETRANAEQMLKKAAS